MGPYPKVNQEDADLINAGNESISAVDGASFFGSSVSFGMYRGRHMNMTILGGMQVSRKGDIANWVVPNRLIKAINNFIYVINFWRIFFAINSGNGWSYGSCFFRS